MSDDDEFRIEPSPKRIRGFLGGERVFDTTGALLVWEVPYYPTYYVPVDDVEVEMLDSGATSDSKTRGRAEYFDLKVGTAFKHKAGCRYPESPVERIRDHVRFDWSAMDEWLEEDEPVYAHARDPYKRVDILSSSRRIEIVVDGVKVAESHKPTILFETGLPPRYYLPLTDVRTDLLVESETRTHCPYKGTASYWSLDVEGRRREDFVWIYRTPLPESAKIAGLVSFYNEKVDLYVDGELQSRPRTKFSES